MLELVQLQRLHVGPVDLRLEGGTCACVMGASGAGKSVLLRMIADLDPHAGDATLDGRAASAMPAPDWRRQVGYVAADAGWWAPRVADHFPPGTDFATLEAVGVAPAAADWPVSRLSTGERQRLALLRALQPAARFLLLDEPTSGLDVDNVARVEALLRAAMARGLGLLLVTHDPAQAARIGHRRFVLQAGRLEEHAA